MIHELLLALSGYPGTIFTCNKRTGLQVKRERLTHWKAVAEGTVVYAQKWHLIRVQHVYESWMLLHAQR